MMLPTWCATPIGRALIAEVLAARPDSRPIRDDWGTRDYPRYSGKPAALVRKLHREWLQTQYSRLDRRFAITGVWDAAEGRAIHEVEDADSLIGRLLAEASSDRRAA